MRGLQHICLKHSILNFAHCDSRINEAVEDDMSIISMRTEATNKCKAGQTKKP